MIMVIPSGRKELFTPQQCKRISHPWQRQSPRIHFAVMYTFHSKTSEVCFPQRSSMISSMELLTPEVQRSSPAEVCLISISQQLGRKVVFSLAEFYGYSSPQTYLIQKIPPNKVIISITVAKSDGYQQVWQIRA